MMEPVESTDLGEMIEPMTTDIVDQKQLAERLLEQAKEQNIELVGPALDAEMSEHLGYEKHDPAGRLQGHGQPDH